MAKIYLQMMSAGEGEEQGIIVRERTHKSFFFFFQNS